MNIDNSQTDDDTHQIKTSLPDRSDLSKLYFTPKEPTVTIDQKAHILDANTISQTIREYALKIGLLVPLPFLIAIVPATFFVTAVTQATLFAALPLMILCGVVAVLIFKKIRSLINHLSLPSFTFLCLQISCLMSTIPSIYYLSLLAPESILLRLSTIYLLTLIASTIFCWSLLQLMLNDTLSNKTRVRIIGLIVSICFISVSGYIAINLI